MRNGHKFLQKLQCCTEAELLGASKTRFSSNSIVAYGLLNPLACINGYLDQRASHEKKEPNPMLDKRFSISVFLMVTLLITQTAHAVTYYVDRLLPGKDSNAGTTENTAFFTIAKCVTVAINPGDTCLVKNGTYTETINLRYSGTAGKPITLNNYPGHSPVIKFATSSSRVYIQSILGGVNSISYVTVEGFEITGGWDGVKFENANNLVLRRNRIHHNHNQGILGWGYQVTIDQNTVNHNGRFTECASTPSVCNKDHGLYISGTYFTITNNIVYDNLAHGIQVAGYPYDPASHTSPAYAGGSNWTIANNTIAYQNYGVGIIFWQPGATNDRIENNIFYQNARLYTGGAQGVAFYNCGRGHIVRNNHMYATAPGSVDGIADTAGGASYTASDNLINVSNPNMLNAPGTLPASPNFSLQSTSPAIDKGLHQSIIKVDYAGSARPQGSAFDIGAYEGAGQSGTGPAAPRNLKVF
jgi:hypothetical protein